MKKEKRRKVGKMNIKKFIKEDMGIRVRLTGDAMELNCMDIAKGLFTRENKIKGKSYETIRWDRIKEYLDSDKFAHYWAKENAEISWLPEGDFYKLLMKTRGADNEKAEKFQNWLAFEVLPSLRKNNYYVDKDNINKEQTEMLKEYLFELCDCGKISLGRASQKIFGNKKELRERLTNLGLLDYEKGEFVQQKFKDSRGVEYELFVVNVSGKYEDGIVTHNMQVSITNAGFIFLKNKFAHNTELGK